MVSQIDFIGALIVLKTCPVLLGEMGIFLLSQCYITCHYNSDLLLFED